MQQLNGMDSLFLQAELPGLPMLVSSVGIYDPATSPDGRVRFKDILKVFENGIPETSLFRRRLVNVPMELDHPYWIEDPDFDVEFHVRHIALPYPGDWRQLYIQLARLQSRPLDKSRPLWEAYVIEGLNNLDGIPKGSFCVMLKVHHAAMDGMGAMELLTSMHDLSPSKPARRQRHTGVLVEPRPTNWSLLAKAMTNQVKRSSATTRALGENLLSRNRVKAGIRDGKFAQQSDRVRTRFNTKASPYRSIGKYSMSLAEVEAIAQATDSSSQDIMLSLVSGALHKYLSAKNELPLESLVAGTPKRGKRDNDSDISGNSLEFLNIQLRTELTDPMERLAAVKEASASANAYSQASGSNTVGNIVESLPPAITSGLLKVMLTSGFGNALDPTQNTVVHYIPGVKIPVYLGGAKLIDTFALGPVTNNLGLFHAVTSLYDDITIAVTACRQMLPDPAFYCKCIQDSYEELREAVNAGKPAKAAGRTNSGKSAKKAVSKDQAAPA